MYNEAILPPIFVTGHHMTGTIGAVETAADRHLHPIVEAIAPIAAEIGKGHPASNRFSIE